MNNEKTYSQDNFWDGVENDRIWSIEEYDKVITLNLVIPTQGYILQPGTVDSFLKQHYKSVGYLGLFPESLSITICPYFLKN